MLAYTSKSFGNYFVFNHKPQNAKGVGDVVIAIQRLAYKNGHVQWVANIDDELEADKSPYLIGYIKLRQSRVHLIADWTKPIDGHTFLNIFSPKNTNAVRDSVKSLCMHDPLVPAIEKNDITQGHLHSTRDKENKSLQKGLTILKDILDRVNNWDQFKKVYGTMPKQFKRFSINGSEKPRRKNIKAISKKDLFAKIMNTLEHDDDKANASDPEDALSNGLFGNVSTDVDALSTLYHSNAQTWVEIKSAVGRTYISLHDYNHHYHSNDGDIRLDSGVTQLYF